MTRKTAKPERYKVRMSIPELAERLECSEPKAYEIAESGRFGSFREGSTYFISRKAVENWIEGRPAPNPLQGFLHRVTAAVPEFPDSEQAS